MKVLYYGGTFCTEATLKRLLVVAQEITFIDRPSVKLSETSGTVGTATEARSIAPLDPKYGIVISAHAPYDKAVPMYQQYLQRDWQSAAFRRAVLRGLNDPVFAGRLLALDGNYGDATGQQIRDALLADPALRAPDLPAINHSTMFKIDTPEGRIETLGSLVSEASIMVSGALVGASDTGCAPITDDETLAALFAARCAEVPGDGGQSAALAVLGDEIARSVLPDWVLAQLSIPDILDYRAKTKDAYAAWLADLDALVISLEEVKAENYQEEAKKLIRSKVNPKITEYKRAMASVRDGMFGGLVSSAPSWAVPAVVVAYLVGGPVAALIGGLAQAGLTAGVTYYNGKRKAGRDHAVSYLLRLVEEQKPLLTK